MPNTAEKPGNNDIKTFINALMSNESSPLMMVLDVLHIYDAGSHDRAIQIMGDLMDEIGDVEFHPAHRFMELLADSIAHYEASLYGPLPRVSPLEMLKYLMEAQTVKQSDIADIFGSQGNVSQVLKGEREINLKHIRKLAERFNVNPAVFI